MTRGLPEADGLSLVPDRTFLRPVSPFRRILTIAALVLATMTLAASCSTQQAQARFAVRGTPVPTEKASQIAEY